MALDSKYKSGLMFIIPLILIALLSLTVHRNFEKFFVRKTMSISLGTPVNGESVKVRFDAKPNFFNEGARIVKPSGQKRGLKIDTLDYSFPFFREITGIDIVINKPGETRIREIVLGGTRFGPQEIAEYFIPSVGYTLEPGDGFMHLEGSRNNAVLRYDRFEKDGIYYTVKKPVERPIFWAIPGVLLFIYILIVFPAFRIRKRSNCLKWIQALLDKQINIRPFLLSLLVNVVLFALYFIFTAPAYGTNDDVSIMMIASGYRTGSPSEYLIALNIIIGKLLRFLYASAPGVNWYTAFLLSIHYISMVLILFSFLNRRRTVRNLLLFLLIFMLFELHFLMRLHWTTTAFVTAQGALAFLLFTHGKNKCETWLYGIAGTALFVLSGLIREEVFISCFVFGLPFYIRALIKKQRLILVSLISALALFSVLTQYNKWYYGKDPNWSDYMEYNGLRGMIHGYMDNDALEALEELGWSWNDFKMFLRWFYIDQEYYSIDKLEILNLYSSRSNPFTELKSLRAADVPHYISEVFINRKLYGFCFLLFPLYMLLMIRRKKNTAIVLSVLIMTFLTTGYLYLIKRIPDRTVVPLFSMASIFILRASGDVHESHLNTPWSILKTRHVSILFLGVLFVLLCVSQFFIIGTMSKTHKNRNINFNAMIEELNPTAEQIFVLWGSSFPIEWISPYSNLHEYKDINAIPLGWLLHSPLYRDILNKNEIEDLEKAILTRKNLYIFSKMKSYMYRLNDYYYEHHGLYASFKPVYKTKKTTAYDVMDITPYIERLDETGALYTGDFTWTDRSEELAASGGTGGISARIIQKRGTFEISAGPGDEAEMRVILREMSDDDSTFILRYTIDRGEKMESMAGKILVFTCSIRENAAGTGAIDITIEEQGGDRNILSVRNEDTWKDYVVYKYIEDGRSRVLTEIRLKTAEKNDFMEIREPRFYLLDSGS